MKVVVLGPRLLFGYATVAGVEVGEPLHLENILAKVFKTVCGRSREVFMSWMPNSGTNMHGQTSN
jgi:hypothetical protein